MSKRNFLRTLLAIAIMMLLASGNSWAATATWDGSAGDNKWSTAANWDISTVPADGDDIVITATADVTIYIDQDINIGDLTITSSGAFDVNIYPAATGTFTVTIGEDIVLDGGTTPASDIITIHYNNGNGRLNWVFSSTAAQTITNTDGNNVVEFNNLTVSNTHASGLSTTITLGSPTFTVYGNLTVSENAKWIETYVATKTLIIAGTNSSITVPSTGTLTLSNITIAATASNVTMSGSATMLGVFTVASGGKFTQTSGTMTMNQAATAGAAIIVNTGYTTRAGADYLTFFNLTIDDGAAITLATSFTVAGNLTWDMTTAANTFTAGYLVFKNDGTPNNPKNITLSGQDAADFFLNIVIDDDSYVTTASNIWINGTTNAFEVVGSGSFKATAGTITFLDAAVITASSASTLKFYNLTIGDGADAVTTSSNFTVLNDFTIGNVAATFVASAPSTITFANSTADGGDGAGVLTSTAHNAITFNNVVVTENSNIDLTSSVAGDDINIKGDLTVNNLGSFDATSTATDPEIAFTTATTKNITNYGELKFDVLTIENTAGNLVQTSSNFTVEDIFTVGANGQFIASGNSTITLALAGVSPVNTTQSNLQFQNVEYTAAATPASDYIVKGDFISDAAYAATAGEILFQGTSQQRIYGSTAPTLFTFELNNSNGIKLEQNLTVSGTTLTLTSGDLDLNGFNVTMSNAAPVITEDYDNGYIITNSSETPAYIGITEAALVIADVTGSNIGITSITEAVGTDAIESYTVYRYLATKYINGKKTSSRYYQVLANDDDGDTEVTGITFEYDAESELNGNTEDNLAGFYTLATKVDNTYFDNIVSPDTRTDPADSWAAGGGTVTAQSGATAGTIALTGLVSDGIATAGLTDNTAYVFAFIEREIELSEWPTTGVDDYYTEDMPLVAGVETGSTADDATDDVVLMKFALQSTATASVEKFTITLSNNITGIFDDADFLLGYSAFADLDDASSSTDIAATFSTSGNTLTVTPSSAISLTAGTPLYFYIAGDVSSSVSSATQHIIFTLGTNGITADDFGFTGSSVSSPEISFVGQEVALSPNNTPLSQSYMQGSTFAEIFGFTLTPEDNTPTITISSVRVKVTLDDGAETDDYSSFALYLDDNKNGIYDTGDDALQTGVSMDASGYLNFIPTGNNTLTAEEPYLVTCTIASDAIVGGTISMSIESSNDVQLASPATITTDGPYDGGTFTTVDDNLTPTRLVVTNFGMDDYTSLLTDLPEKTGREVVSGENINITIESQDDNGNQADVTSNTGVSITITSGTATVANGTGTINSGSYSVNITNLTLTNALGYGPITITVTPTSGMTSLTPATYSNIVVYADEETWAGATEPYLTVTTASITTTAIPLTWTNAGSDDVIVVAREGALPVAPSDGVVYDQVAGNDFSATTGSGNYFTDTDESVVVYKGTSTGVTVSGLTPGTTYYFAVYPYNGGTASTSKPNYYTVDIPNGTYGTNVAIAHTLDNQPTSAANTLTFTTVTANSIKMNWINGNGDGRIVVMGIADPSTTPTDTIVYTANSAYGDASTKLGDGFVVYNGTSNSVTVTNLDPDELYYVRIYEYNGEGTATNYYTSAYEDGSRYTLDYEPTIQASQISFAPQTQSSANNLQLIMSWVRGNGDGCYVVGKAGEAISSGENPKDQADVDSYTANAAFGTGDRIGDGYVVYSGTSNTQTVTGLQYGQTYYFKVFEYNSGSGTNTDSTTSTINFNTSDATNNPNYGVADSYEPNNTMATAKYINSNGTLYNGIISNASDADWYSIEPDVANDKKYMRIKLMNQPMNYTIELYNEDGRRLRSSKFTGTTDEVIVINNLPEGVYYIKVYSEAGDYSITPYRVNALESELEYKSETP